MPTLKANGITLSYDSFGDDSDETILLISGLGVQMIRWATSFCEALTSRGYRVIRFDNRDTGCSTHLTNHATPDFGELTALLASGKRPDVAYTLLNMADDAIGLLDALAIERAHFVGRSMGGMIAQIVACEHAGRVMSLTSIMSSTGNPSLPSASPEVMAMMMRQAPSPMEDEAGFLEHGVAFARLIAGRRFSFDEKAYRAVLLEEVRRSYDPGGFSRQIAAIAATGDRRSRLACIDAPTLVVHGTDDPLIPPDCGRETASLIPNAELLLIDGMGHDLPPELHHVIANGIERVARRASSAA